MRSKTFQQMVTEFHKVFGHPIGQEPQFLCEKLFNRRIDWMREEIDELEEATHMNDQLDALTDLLYFTIGFFVEMGVDSQKIFEIVHEANMNKASEGIKHTSEGKIIKPSDWIPPETKIAEFLEKVKQDARLQDVLQDIMDKGIKNA